MTKITTKEGNLIDSEFIIRELRQLDRLLASEPEISVEELAHRLAQSKRQVKFMLRKLGGK